MPKATKEKVNTALQYIRFFIKWLVIAGVIGIIGGLIGSAFCITVDDVTIFREAHQWMIWLLPVGGLIIAALYKLTKMEHTNTNAIIDSIHFGENVPLLLIPAIFVGTALTHLFGGSAGREGAALQIGGGLGWNIGRIFRLDEKDMRLATLCGMSAVFSALFGTPLTATFFALEISSVGLLYFCGLVPCIVSSVTAFGVSILFGIAPTQFYVASQPLEVTMLIKVGVLAIICAVVSIIFCESMHGTENLAVRKIPNPFLRVAVGGAIIVALTYLCGSYDYNGVGVSVIKQAIEGGTAHNAAFFWKMAFTAITIGFGFKGGEVVPTFFIGATLGCVIGPLLGIPAGFAAAIGLVAMFCGAVNCPVASIVMSVELFGSGSLLYFAATCGIAYMLSGNFGIYSSQKIMYSKIKAEYINIHSK